MSTSTPSTGRGRASTGQMPSILTNSALAMIDYYGNSIVELKATASRVKTDWSEEMDDIGLDLGIKSGPIAEWHYTQSRDSRGNPENGLGDKRDEIEEKIASYYEENLGDHYDGVAWGEENFLDFAVQEMTVEIESPALQELEDRETDVFDFVFKSVKADDPEETLEINEGAGLHRSGKSPRDLDLVAVYETRDVHGPERAEPVIERSNSKAIPDCSDTTANEIVETLLPETFADKKRYIRIEEETILVV